jgi:predicted Zn-dependent peptidase
VTKQKVAVAAAGFPDFPGEKYPSLFTFYGVTAPGKTNEDLEKAMMAEIVRLKNELVSEEELNGVKRRWRAGLLSQMNSNTSMAGLLAKFEVLMGNWAEAFDYLEKVNKVTAADVQRVAKKTFVDSNRTIAYLEPLQKASQ